MGGDPGNSTSDDERLAEEAQAALRESLERAHEMICDAKLIAAERKPKSGRRTLFSPASSPPSGSVPEG